MNASDSSKLRFVCACGAAYRDLAGIVDHYASLHARIMEVVPDNRPRNDPAVIAEGMGLVSEGATVAEAAEAVGLPRSTLQWHVARRGGVAALRDAVTT